MGDSGCLSSAQVITPQSWDGVPPQSPHREPASPSACVSVSLSVSLMNKYIQSFFLKRVMLLYIYILIIDMLQTI